MSMNISLNFCQKVCVVIPTDTCSFSVISWTSSDTNLINVFGNGNNAILKPVYGATGFVAVTASDITGSSFIIFVTITSFFDVVVTLPKYKYLFSTSLSGGGSPGSSATINGPWNSLIVPFTTNACVLIGFNGALLNLITFFASQFIPGTNSITKIFGNYPNSVDIGFALFMPTVNTESDPLLLYASLFYSPGPIASAGTSHNSKFYTTVPPICEAGDYNTIIQWVWPNSNILSWVMASEFLPDSSIVFQTFDFTQPSDYTGIVIPNGYYNPSSSSLIYSQRHLITFNSTGTVSISITIPSIPVGSVIWFAQKYGTLLTQPGLRVDNIQHNSPTQITLTGGLISVFFTPPYSITACIVAYKNQTNIGFNLTFP